MYYIKLLWINLIVQFMSYEDMLYYAYVRRYRVIGTCGGYRLQYVGFLLKENNYNKIIFKSLEDMVIFLALNK